MLKVMTIVGTRPELIKMSRVIAEFDRHTQHVLVHTRKGPVRGVVGNVAPHLTGASRGAERKVPEV